MVVTQLLFWSRAYTKTPMLNKQATISNSYRFFGKILQSFKGTRLVFRVFWSLWYLASASAGSCQIVKIHDCHLISQVRVREILPSAA